jgi:hypothetical protein
MKRFTAKRIPELGLIAIDLGYSSVAKSCGIAASGETEASEHSFGKCIEVVTQRLIENEPSTLILEAVLSTYHNREGNPAIRGDFEKGRGWYHGPGVSTFAAAIRFLGELDHALPPGIRPIPLIEGFLSYKPSKTSHRSDAQRMLTEFTSAECFIPCSGSEPITDQIEGVPEILRFNPRPGER